jgi:hypothetical protein
MGMLLRETERQKPGEYQQRLHEVTVAPTLAELGLTKRESAEAQALAALPIALDAERKMGQMLQVSERAKNRFGPGRGKAGNQAAPAFPDAPPTLDELGVTKRESEEAQALVVIPTTFYEAPT